MAATTNALLTRLLKETSRSFYLTLRILPRKVRSQIGLAYLLARTTDTIADTEIVPMEQRLAALQNLRNRILGMGNAALDFGELARNQALPAERMLLEKAEESLRLLENLAAGDLKLVRQVLATITSGQELDLRRFSGASVNGIIALPSNAELDDYTYRVAGCVGKFWTDMCLDHLFRLPELQGFAAPHFEELGVRFGKGLQFVNILRDLPADLRRGRCYLPVDELAALGLRPADLLSPTSESKFRPLFDRYLDLAESNLAAGWKYTNLIPFTLVSLRLACAWPILIGAKTITRLRTASVLNPQARVKISRAEVRALVAQSLLRYPLPRYWRKMVMFSTEAIGKQLRPA